MIRPTVQSLQQRITTLEELLRRRASVDQSGYETAMRQRRNAFDALERIWCTLINQTCLAGAEAFKIADDALDKETKQRLAAELNREDEDDS